MSRKKTGRVLSTLFPKAKLHNHNTIDALNQREINGSISTKYFPDVWGIFICFILSKRENQQTRLGDYKLIKMDRQKFIRPNRQMVRISREKLIIPEREAKKRNSRREQSMFGRFRIRTDLALEARESFEEDDVKIRGVRIEEEDDEELEIHTTRVVIETENGAKTMGKPVGTYITMEAPNMSAPDEDYHREISQKLAEHLKSLMGEGEKSVLIVGLGNRDVTPDALGPYVVGNICITRHMIREFGAASLGEEQRNPVSGIVPGVMAQTGMETLEIIRGVVKETHPDLIIAVDALAARSTRRLNRTIQITDTGINPGSGVGNHRNGLNKQVLGIPVIAIGVPTVVDAATIVNDTMESLIHALDMEDYAQKYQLIKERIPSHLNTMFVTPKDIDETVKRLSYTISEGLNLALQLA